MMIEKEIGRLIIMNKLKISKSLLSKALKGKRKAALRRVAEFVRLYNPRSHATGRPKKY